MPGHSRQALKGQRRAEETVDNIQTQTQHKIHTTRHDTTQCAATEEENLFSRDDSLSRRLSLCVSLSLSSLRLPSLARAVTQQQQQRLLLFRAVAPAAAQG